MASQMLHFEKSSHMTSHKLHHAKNIPTSHQNVYHVSHHMVLCEMHHAKRIRSACASWTLIRPLAVSQQYVCILQICWQNKITEEPGQSAWTLCLI